MKVRTLLLTALLAFAMVPSSAAQIYSCGVVDVIFLNPDLNTRAESGVITANGAFFAQFQVIGDRADEVEYIGFSFGKDTIPQDASVCPDDADYNGYYFTGQQILNYRADLDPTDGFFINLQTELVPDGDYTAAVHAYDAEDNELGRFWARAAVDNCNDDDEDQRCGDDPEQITAHDETIPWPILLPGDGEHEGTGFSIEVAEELSSWKVILNGEDITSELSPWEGRLWDNDLRPGYGPFGALGDNQVTAECAIPQPSIPQANECSTLGQAFTWNTRDLETGDVLNVELVDLAGNIAKKDVHVGFGITGGISSGSYPILQWQADSVIAEVEAGKSAEFTFTIQNLGTEVGHPFSRDELQVVPEGWDFKWTPHQTVQSGEATSNTFTVTVPADAETGAYKATAGMAYAGQNNQEQQLQQILTLNVIGSAAPVEGANPDGEEEKGSPGFGSGLAALALLGAALVAVRRQN